MRAVDSLLTNLFFTASDRTFPCSASRENRVASGR
jgi:hypothetical protein